MTLPKLCLIDRDSTLNFASSDPESPLYYITDPSCLVLKPGAREAIHLLKAHGIPMILVTRQRCVSKGLVSRETVEAIHARLEVLLGIEFDGICVEETAEDKGALYHAILSNYPMKPEEVVLFDDSGKELYVASQMGIQTYAGAELLESVKHLLHL
jgi:histidinol phosphatase-like enzyme